MRFDVIKAAFVIYLADGFTPCSNDAGILGAYTLLIKLDHIEDLYLFLN